MDQSENSRLLAILSIFLISVPGCNADELSKQQAAMILGDVTQSRELKQVTIRAIDTGGGGFRNKNDLNNKMRELEDLLFSKDSDYNRVRERMYAACESYYCRASLDTVTGVREYVDKEVVGSIEWETYSSSDQRYHFFRGLPMATGEYVSECETVNLGLNNFAVRCTIVLGAWTLDKIIDIRGEDPYRIVEYTTSLKLNKVGKHLWGEKTGKRKRASAIFSKRNDQWALVD